MVRYPDDFKERVKAEFPNSPDLHAALDLDSPIVSRYLIADMMNDETFAPEDIISALDQGRQDELRQAAERALRVRALYEELQKIRIGDL